MTALLALALVLSGAAAAWLAYLASPQQQWRSAGPLPTLLALGIAALCALASLLAAMRLMAMMEAVFAWTVLLMLVWSIAPFIGLWRARRRAGQVAS